MRLVLASRLNGAPKRWHSKGDKSASHSPHFIPFCRLRSRCIQFMRTLRRQQRRRKDYNNASVVVDTEAAFPRGPPPEGLEDEEKMGVYTLPHYSAMSLLQLANSKLLSGAFYS